MTGVREGSAAGRAQTLNDLGRAAEALTVVSSGLAEEPQDVDLLVQGAVALVQLDRDDEAVRYCLAAAAADPDSVVVQKVLSVALRGAGDRVGAYHAAVRATQLAPHDPGAHIQVAHSASDLRDPHNGRMAAEYALRLAPSSPSAHLAMVAALFPPGSPPSKATMREAEQHARTALSLRPDDHVALDELARIQMARGRLVSAAGHLSTSVRAAPFETVMQRNMDLVLTGLIARFHWILFLVWFVGTQVVGAANGQPPRWLLVLLGAIGAVALGWIAWQAPGAGARRHAPGVPARLRPPAAAGGGLGGMPVAHLPAVPRRRRVADLPRADPVRRGWWPAVPRGGAQLGPVLP